MEKLTYSQECLARAEKATPGPWDWRLEIDNYYDVVSKGLLYQNGYPRFVAGETSRKDCEFIAHSRTDVPELAKRLQKACEALRQAQTDFSERGIECFYGDIAKSLEAPLGEKE